MNDTSALPKNDIKSSTPGKLGICDLPMELQQIVFDEYFKQHTGYFIGCSESQVDPDRMQIDEKEVVADHKDMSERLDLGPTALLLTSKSILAAARPRLALHFPLLVRSKAAFVYEMATRAAGSVRSIIVDHKAWHDAGASGEAPEQALLTPLFRDSSIERVEYRSRPHLLALCYRPLTYNSNRFHNNAVQELVVEVQKNDCFVFHTMLRDFCPRTLHTFRYRVLAVENCMQAAYQAYWCSVCRAKAFDFINLDKEFLDMYSSYARESRNLGLEKPWPPCQHTVFPSWREFCQRMDEWPHDNDLNRLIDSVVCEEWAAMDNWSRSVARRLTERRVVAAEGGSMEELEARRQIELYNEDR